MRYSVKMLKRYNGPTGEYDQSKKQFQTFEDLEVYQVAREFRKTMYRVSRRLPDFERFELASQIRRAAVSLTNNIAEGHGRYHYPDQIRFLLQARGSLEELIDDLNVCFDEKYLPPGDLNVAKAEGWRVLNLINGYGRFLRQKKAATASVLHDELHEDLSTNGDDPFADSPL